MKTAALDTLKAIVDALNEIASSSDDKETRDKVVDALLKIADQVATMDKRNNRFFYGAMVMLGSVVVSVIARRPIRMA